LWRNFYSPAFDFEYGENFMVRFSVAQGSLVPSSFFLLSLILTSEVAIAKGSKPPKDPPSRQLKKIVSLGKIKAKGIEVENVGTFDLENAVNRQFAAAVLEAGNFTVKMKKNSNNNTVTLQSTGEGSFKPMGYDDSPQDPEVCLPDPATIKLSGEILGFDIESINGGHFGYSPGGAAAPVADVKVRVVNSSMTGVFEATDNKEELLFGATQISSKQTKTYINADVSFKDFILGFEHFSQSPISKVTFKGIKMGVQNLAKETDKYPWEGMVIATENRRFVAINAGIDADLKKGDKFQIRNVKHQWKGTPCKSEYVRGKPDREAIAVGVVSDVQPTYSWLEVTQYFNSEGMIEVGAKVTVDTLAQ